MNKIFERLAERPTLSSAIWLMLALAGAAFVIWGFAELADGIVEGESRAFDRNVLLWIGGNSPG